VQGRFPAAGFADDGERLALAEREIDARQRLHGRTFARTRRSMDGIVLRDPAPAAGSRALAGGFRQMSV